jgi:NAD(P)-dependent dehydrogenase (short-subunit alcohol dehydrogenase family)
VTTIPAPVTSTSGGTAEFDGIRALVTGGASGIGRAITRALRMRGATVASLDLRPLTEPEEDILEIACDVGNDASVREAVAEVAERLSGLDVVVSNAGIGSAGRVEDVTDEEWHHILDINVVGTARLCARAAPSFASQRPPDVQPLCARAPSPPGPAWSSAQRTAPARVPCTHSSSQWQADLVREGVRVNAVAPRHRRHSLGPTAACAAPDPDAALAALPRPTARPAASSPQKRSPTPVCYLASRSPGATTGTILQVDCGSTHSSCRLRNSRVAP